MRKRLARARSSTRPRLPAGAVRGDVSKQVFCPAHYKPKLFYLNETRTCVQCDSSFTFAAAEQKYWYETLKFNFRSVPIRCLGCRRQSRSDHALREAVAQAKTEARRCSDDPKTQLALARSIIELFRRTGTGNLDEAIAAARQASQSQRPEPLYWEGVAHLAANRPARGRDCLTRFLAREPTGKENRALVKSAERLLAGHD